MATAGENPHKYNKLSLRNQKYDHKHVFITDWYIAHWLDIKKINSTSYSAKIAN